MHVLYILLHLSNHISIITFWGLLKAKFIPAILLGMYQKIRKGLKRYLYTSVHSIICYDQKVEATQVSISR